MGAADTVEVLPDQLSKAAGEMHSLADDLNTVLHTLLSTLDTLGTPWGDDSYGHKFAEGDAGYLAAKQNLVGTDGTTSGTQGLASTLRSFGNGMSATAHQFTRNEEAATETFSA